MKHDLPVTSMEELQDLLERVADLSWRMSYCEAREEMGLPVGGAVPGPKDAPKMDLSKPHDRVSMYSHIVDKALEMFNRRKR